VDDDHRLAARRAHESDLDVARTGAAPAEPGREAGGGREKPRARRSQALRGERGTGHADQRRARARVRIPLASLTTDDVPGVEVAERVRWAQELAANDPYRAATHNKGIMNGVDAVALATGNDWRAIEAGAHAYAARDGHYRPLSTWTVDDGHLAGTIEMPMATSIVGRLVQSHPQVALALRILNVESARELAMVMVAVGLASNLGALRALVTSGIQRGHMALHARAAGMS